jgi:hypothetical protein
VLIGTITAEVGDDMSVGGVEAVIFDIGGVLEITPPTGWEQRWARRVALTPAQLTERLEPIWSQGELGTLGLLDVEHQTAGALGLDQRGLRAFMDDLWAEYLGALNERLAGYFRALRPSYRTAILSNSFVGRASASRPPTGLRTCAMWWSTRTRKASRSPTRALMRSPVSGSA